MTPKKLNVGSESKRYRMRGAALREASPPAGEGRRSTGLAFELLKEDVETLDR